MVAAEDTPCCAVAEVADTNAKTNAVHPQKQPYSLHDYTEEESINNRIRTGKTLTYTGIGLVVSSPVLFVAGFGVEAFGIVNQKQASIFPALGLFALSTLNFLAGIPLVVTGGVLWGTGRKKQKRLHSNQWQMQGVIKPNGQVGFALKF